MSIFNSILNGLSGRSAPGQIDVRDMDAYSPLMSQNQQNQSGAAMAPQNPMAEVMQSLSNLQDQGNLTLDMIIDRTQTNFPNISAYDIANMSGLNMQQVTFTQSGIDRLRSLSGDNNLCLNLRGADIGGSVFHPASTFEGCLVDEVTIGAETQAQHVTFSGFDHKANLDLAKGDWSYFSLEGAQDNSLANHAHLTLGQGVSAVGGDISDSRFTIIDAAAADVSGLDASGAKSLVIHANGTRLNGASFQHASFAPGSYMHADLIGADLSHAAGELDLSNARLIGANMEGSDISHWNLNHAILREQDLHGAKATIGGQLAEISAENVQQFIQERAQAGQEMSIVSEESIIKTQMCGQTIQGPIADVIGRVERLETNIEKSREAGLNKSHEHTQIANRELVQTDSLIETLCKTNTSMAVNAGMTRSTGMDGADRGVGEQHQSAVYQREHEVPTRGPADTTPA